MEWVVGAEGERQTVKSGDATCVPVTDWCQHQFLANLPGNTMALGLKYRLLCGSVILSTPLLYHEWYYSQLTPGQHYFEVDLAWSSAPELLAELRGRRAADAQAVGLAAQRFAKQTLTEDGFDCYWFRLIQLASRHFPEPRLRSDSVPLETALFATGLVSTRAGSAEQAGMHHLASLDSADAFKPQVDAIVVIPARAADTELMDHARRTWLREESGVLSRRHFFVLASGDPEAAALVPAAATVDEARLPLLIDDILIVRCQHGYTNLLTKMALAYRALLKEFEVSFFIRADVDSVIPLPLLLSLLPVAASGRAVMRLPQTVSCGNDARWQWPSVGHLVCQTECAMDSGCLHFTLDEFGNCATFRECHEGGQPGFEVYAYQLRSSLRNASAFNGLSSSEKMRTGRSFILGTILHGNKVLTNDTYNPQWNNLRYTQDLGIHVYPPYPEASGYAMSASVAAYIAGVGEGTLATLAWNAWAIEDAAMGTILAGLRLDMLLLPKEVRDRIRVIRVNRTPA